MFPAVEEQNFILSYSHLSTDLKWYDQLLTFDSINFYLDFIPKVFLLVYMIKQKIGVDTLWLFLILLIQKCVFTNDTNELEKCGIYRMEDYQNIRYQFFLLVH